jgi:hypothetical protein
VVSATVTTEVRRGKMVIHREISAEDPAPIKVKAARAGSVPAST